MHETKVSAGKPTGQQILNLGTRKNAKHGVLHVWTGRSEHRQYLASVEKRSRCLEGARTPYRLRCSELMPSAGIPVYYVECLL